MVVVPRVGRSGLPLYICADPSNFEPTTGVLAVLDDHEIPKSAARNMPSRWRDWLRWSNVLQFLTVPRHGESMPLRMAEIWTRKSAERSLAHMFPQRGGSGPNRRSHSRCLTSGRKSPVLGREPRRAGDRACSNRAAGP